MIEFVTEIAMTNIIYIDIATDPVQVNNEIVRITCVVFEVLSCLKPALTFHNY